MATSTILQNHSPAMTVTSVAPNAKIKVTVSGTYCRGIILVGGTTSTHFPFICGFRFNQTGSTLTHYESPNGSTVISIDKSSSGNNIMEIASTSSFSTTVVIFMDNGSVTSIESV